MMKTMMKTLMSAYTSADYTHNTFADYTHCAYNCGLLDMFGVNASNNWGQRLLI